MHLEGGKKKASGFYEKQKEDIVRLFNTNTWCQKKIIRVIEYLKSKGNKMWLKRLCIRQNWRSYIKAHAIINMQELREGLLENGRYEPKPWVRIWVLEEGVQYKQLA